MKARSIAIVGLLLLSSTAFAQGLNKRKLRRVLLTLESHWASKNFKAFGALWSEDADLLSEGGEQLRTREAIQSYWKRKHAALGKANLGLVAKRFRALGEDFVLVDGLWSLRGGKAIVGQPRKGRFSVILKRKGDRWRVAHGRFYITGTAAPKFRLPKKRTKPGCAT